MIKSYDVKVPNKLVVVPEPGILFTRDNAREAGRSIPEQDELCDELAAFLFPAARPAGGAHTADCGLQGSGLEKRCTCQDPQDEPPYPPDILIEYLSHRTDHIGTWLPGVFLQYSGQGGRNILVRSVADVIRDRQVNLVRPLTEVRRIPAETISAARSWVANCDWADLDDDEDVADLTDIEIVAGVHQLYGGGWTQFVIDGSP